MSTKKPQKPIRVFYGVLSGRFYASQQYREARRGDKIHYTITGKKYDVTQDIAEAIMTHGITFDYVDEHQEETA